MNPSPTFLAAGTLLLSLGLSYQGNAAMITEFSPQNLPAVFNAPVSPTDYADGVSSSNFVNHGTTRSGFGYFGWATTFSDSIYAGFTVQAEPGSSITLGSLSHGGVVTTSLVDAFRWGYRVDEGSGYGAWQFSNVISAGDPGFGSVLSKTWDFADFTTTGTVEFGFFAKQTGPDDPDNEIYGVANVATGNIKVALDGSVSAVPEPSTSLLGAIGVLALFRRRR
jgi:hypothetical protein